MSWNLLVACRSITIKTSQIHLKSGATRKVVKQLYEKQQKYLYVILWINSKVVFFCQSITMQSHNTAVHTHTHTHRHFFVRFRIDIFLAFPRLKVHDSRWSFVLFFTRQQFRIPTAIKRWEHFLDKQTIRNNHFWACSKLRGRATRRICLYKVKRCLFCNFVGSETIISSSSNVGGKNIRLAHASA